MSLQKILPETSTEKGTTGNIYEALYFSRQK